MSANTLENICENMLTHVHKVIHLVVDTFEQGLGTSLTECDSPTVPPAPYIEKTEVTVSDRTLVLKGPARPISGRVKMLASVFERTLGHLMTRR